jgi:hypothetical protein
MGEMLVMSSKFTRQHVCFAWVINVGLYGSLGWALVGVSVPVLWIGALAVSVITVPLGICLAQATFLKSQLVKFDRSSWVTISVAMIFLDILLCTLAFLAFPDWLSVPYSALICGVLAVPLGFYQWQFLRKQFSGATVWIYATAVGVALALLVGGLLGSWLLDKFVRWPADDESIGYRSGLIFFVSGSVGVLVYTLISGAAIAWILRRRSLSRTSPVNAHSD